MVLTDTQQQTLDTLKTQLESYLWEQVYYGEPNPEVVSLFQEGVELNFDVTIKPYQGVDYPTNTVV